MTNATADPDILEEEDQALETRDPQLVPLGEKFIVDPYCLELAPRGARPTIEEMRERTRRVLKIHTASSYWLGDILNLGDSLFGEEASDFIDSNDLPESTVKNVTWVCKNVGPSNRQIAPSWSHAQAVASLKPEQQKKWLTDARTNDWPVAKMKTEIAKSTAKGSEKVAYWLVVQCGSETKQESLSASLEADGYTTVKHSGIKRVVKPKKGKKAKVKGEKKTTVTAKQKRTTKMSAKRRPPK